MKVMTVLLILMMAGLSPIFGGEIYGTIKINGKPIEANVKVEISINNNSQETFTDSKGSYSIQMTAKGKGEIRVHYDKQIPSHAVYSSTSAVRYDFSLINKGGTYYLKRE